MNDLPRRTALKVLGAAAASVGGIGSVAARRPKKSRGTIRKLGHSLLSNPEGGYAEGDVRDDGQYALLGSFFGEGGSFLVDIENPTDPTEVHRLPSSASVRNADVKFDPRDGIYYRSEEPNTGDATIGGVEVVDYGYDTGTVDDPEVVASMDAGPTHNVFPHPNAPFLYAVNEHGEGPGLDVFDVSDPANPTSLGSVGPGGALHDLVIDPERELLHAAYIGLGAGLDGYVIMDASDPGNPTEVGRFDYAGRDSYADVGIDALRDGTPGFNFCHYANYDPDRGIAYVGDEIASGVPGGKHVFDIGWDEGSPADPKHIGFTLSPNAETMGNSLAGIYDWTGHNFDVVTKGGNSLLVSGDYHEGTVVYDVTDPRNPTATDRYATDDGATEAVNDDPIFDLGEAPMAWGADYNAERDLVVTSDFFTGVYVFKVTPSVARGRGMEQ